MEKKENKLTVFMNKIKVSKPIQIAIVVVLLIIIFAIYFSTIKSTSIDDDESTGSVVSYVDALEKSLSKTLSQISGAGNVTVMITVEGGSTIEIAYTIEERKTSSSGSGSSSSNVTENVTIIKTPVLITKNGKTEPIILSETNPKIIGVIIVATGASDVKVRLELLRAAQASLDVDVNCIEIFAGK